MIRVTVFCNYFKFLRFSFFFLSAKTINIRAWSGSEFFGFGFDFHEGFGFGFNRVWMILSHRVYFGFGFEKITKTRRVFGFELIHIIFQLAKMIFTAKTIDITLCNIANQLKTHVFMWNWQIWPKKLPEICIFLGFSYISGTRGFELRVRVSSGLKECKRSGLDRVRVWKNRQNSSGFRVRLNSIKLYYLMHLI